VNYELKWSIIYCSDATTTLAPFKSRLIEEDEDEIPDHNHDAAVHHGQDDEPVRRLVSKLIIPTGAGLL